ncbi:hypothetical protein ABTY96_37470 [Streptomyces sp. NPDC096057]|uniref:hypothetical protein n=1 Tax=Streptomyces sp. NPDC096057 TaxID=3155543 RepID=UPI0033223ED7
MLSADVVVRGTPVENLLARRQSCVEQNRRGELYELAIPSIEDINHEVSADLGDFLALPQMAAEYERIRQLLAPARRVGVPNPVRLVPGVCAPRKSTPGGLPGSQPPARTSPLS